MNSELGRLVPVPPAEPFSQWALVELMGHQRISGRVTEAEIGGCNFIRVDVPEDENHQALTKYLGPASIYGITIVSEETARKLARQSHPYPVSEWDARRLFENPSQAARQMATSDDDNEDEEILL